MVNIKFLSSKAARGMLLFLVCAALTCAVLFCVTCAGSGSRGEVSPSRMEPWPQGGGNGIDKRQASLVMPGKGQGAKPEAWDSPALKDAAVSGDNGINLDRITEIEREGSYFPGLALAESEIREKAGDYAGAAVAAFKELSWAYGSGSAVKSTVEEGLKNALALFESYPAPDSRREAGITAIKACMAFAREEWAEAEQMLTGLLSAGEEPDSFLRWMLLVCSLEGKDKTPGEVQASRSAYGAIRARYRLFPEYWYRGARAFSAGRTASGNGTTDGSLAAAYAEQCINAGPRGPYAADCRIIMASHLGISSNGMDTKAGIRTKAEIEQIIRASVSQNKPEVLAELFPLISLPDNPYTLYALGAMKSLSAVPEYRSFFIDGALKSPGRLGERLNYVSRG
ncbi:MAG: hypothetical protein FWC45_00215 [Treponema sp.]|nr:hypothetical protein [Treponema sp.]